MDSNIYSGDYWQPFTKAKETSQWVAGIGEQLRKPIHTQTLFDKTNDSVWLCQTYNSVWLLYAFANKGHLAVRLCFDPQGILRLKQEKKGKELLNYSVEGALGNYQIKLERLDQESDFLHYSTSFTPKQDVLIQAFPKDIYVLDAGFDPLNTEGVVYTHQHGPTSGGVYFSLTMPLSGSVIYFQNLTSLNQYCQTTQTDVSNSVGAQWPELGFTLPAAKQALPAGTTVIISDAYLCIHTHIPATEFEAADQYLESMAKIYRQLPIIPTEYVDWPKLATLTIQDLENSPKCGRTIDEHFYVNAYVDVTQKPPESMVQLALLVPLWEYQQWYGNQLTLVDKLRQSLPTFYDEDYRTIMRWLPNGDFKEKQEDRSEEQNPTKIDSWYLLHTLMNLGRLAEKGDTEAKKLLMNSLDFAMKAAHQFNYNWPVFYDIRTFDVIKSETAEGKGGELDVAGLYTHVMLQVFDLTNENIYLDEAIKSAERLQGKGFELLYQSNITLMTALTLVKLWRLTSNRLYFDLSRLSIANMVARLWIWESHYGDGQLRSTFMGASPLKDAPYLAAYEEAEIAATMINYLKEAGVDTPDPVRLFFAEYIHYLLSRGRFYFPANLPKEALSTEVKEGHIDTALHIPVEDIGTGWQKAGTVGQEVYGGALPYLLTTYTYHRFKGVPVDVYCNYPITQAEYRILDNKHGYASYQLAGTADRTAQVRLIYRNRSLTNVSLSFMDDNTLSSPVEPIEETRQYKQYNVRGNQHIRVEWSR